MMSLFENIITHRLVLKTFDRSNRHDFFAYRSMPEVYEYQAFRPSCIQEVEDFLNNVAVFINRPDTWFQIAICLKSEKLIGDIGIHFLQDGHQVEIGYTLTPVYQGHGYAKEAVAAIIDYLFNSLNKHRITASVDPQNKKSINLLENMGFRKEAHFIKSFCLNDTWYDDCIYAILKEEWNRRLLFFKK